MLLRFFGFSLALLLCTLPSRSSSLAASLRSATRPSRARAVNNNRLPEIMMGFELVKPRNSRHGLIGIYRPLPNDPRDANYAGLLRGYITVFPSRTRSLLFRRRIVKG